MPETMGRTRETIESDLQVCLGMRERLDVMQEGMPMSAARHLRQAQRELSAAIERMRSGLGLSRETVGPDGQVIPGERMR
jgi:hypothetical protein